MKELKIYDGIQKISKKAFTILGISACLAASAITSSNVLETVNVEAASSKSLKNIRKNAMEVANKDGVRDALYKFQESFNNGSDVLSIKFKKKKEKPSSNCYSYNKWYKYFYNRYYNKELKHLFKVYKSFLEHKDDFDCFDCYYMFVYPETAEKNKQKKY